MSPLKRNTVRLSTTRLRLTRNRNLKNRRVTRLTNTSTGNSHTGDTINKNITITTNGDRPQLNRTLLKNSSVSGTLIAETGIMGTGPRVLAILFRHLRREFYRKINGKANLIFYKRSIVRHNRHTLKVRRQRATLPRRNGNLKTNSFISRIRTGRRLNLTEKRNTRNIRVPGFIRRHTLTRDWPDIVT